MAQAVVFLDACILVPIAPCDTLLRLASLGMFRPLWSTRVVNEALRALERIHPAVDRERFLFRFRSMENAFEGALVQGWERFERDVVLPDPDDRHVVAAALKGGADVILTENVRDFPDEALKPSGLEAIRLDAFLIGLYKLNPLAATRVISEQSAAMKRPAVGREDLLVRLGRSGAPEFAKLVSEGLPGAS